MDANVAISVDNPASEPDVRSAPSSRLTGGWVWVGRAVWLLLMALFVVPFPFGLPAYIANVEHPPAHSTLLSPGAVRALAGAGISLDTYAWISLSVICVTVIVSVSFAIALFWRRGDDWMALLVSLFIAIYPIAIGDSSTLFGGIAPASFLSPLSALIQIAQSVVLFALLVGVVVLFPTGHFVPRWSWIMVVAVSIWGIAGSIAPTIGGGALVLGYPIIVLFCIACMVYRYRRVSTLVQRTQTKWIIAGFAVTLIGNQVFWLPSAFTSLGQTLYPSLVYQLYVLSLALIPITFFIAVQRYRLYDIDRIINRAMVYGSLTAILVGLYAGCVIGAQAIIRSFTHDPNAQTPVVTVATTLLIAALIRPLRARIQRFIDARFYRQKYDAALLLARFGVTLRSEVDLPALSEHLVETVDEAMQPAYISLLLLPTSRESNRQPDARIEHTTKSPQASI